MFVLVYDNYNSFQARVRGNVRASDLAENVVPHAPDFREIGNIVARV
jgi:hypothetical protein